MQPAKNFISSIQYRKPGFFDFGGGAFGFDGLECFQKASYNSLDSTYVEAALHVMYMTCQPVLWSPIVAPGLFGSMVDGLQNTKTAK